MGAIAANDPTLKSWVNVPQGSDFPIQNLPFGVIKTDELTPRVGVRIGDYVLDLKSMFVLGYFESIAVELSDFDASTLNGFMRKGKQVTRDLRNRISKLLSTVYIKPFCSLW